MMLHSQYIIIDFLFSFIISFIYFIYIKASIDFDRESEDFRFNNEPYNRSTTGVIMRDSAAPW